MGIFAVLNNEQMSKIKIYLAGPDVFMEPEKVGPHFDELKALCEKYGFLGLSPFDSTLDLDKYHTPGEKGMAIYKANHELIAKCDVVMANLVPFRGINVDDGTAFEIGAGATLHKRLYGYTTLYNKTLDERTKGYPCSAEIMEYDSKFPATEEFDLPVNLMLACSITESGGATLETFEDCLAHLAENPIK